MRIGRRVRAFLLIAAGGAALLACAAWIAGSLLLRGASSPIPAPHRSIESVRFASADGVDLRGWWWPGRDPERAVLLLHGLHADRRQMFPRAKWLHETGYSVLLFDFRGCGESGGAPSFGYRERLDVEAALRFLRQERRVENLVILGQSLGAAAALMAVDAWKEGVRGAVLESPYDRFENAVRVRVRRLAGFLEPLLSPLLLVQVPLRLGFRPEDLAPVTAIHRASCPVLLGFGGRDPYATPELLRDYFREGPYPTTLWVVQRAGHIDLYRFDPKAYRDKVGEFIARALGPADGGEGG